MHDTLARHATRLKDMPLSRLAAARANLPALTAAGWAVNFSRVHLDDDAEAALVAYGEAVGLGDAVTAMFNGAIVNPSEDRPALHWALRAQSALSGEAETVRQSMQAPTAFADAITTHAILTAGGTPFRAVVHIGIGGSDFGPRLIADAFADRRNRDIDVRFCANVDPLDLARALDGLNPAETLVIGVSKSFGTEETLYNLGRARAWLAGVLGEKAASHLALVTANPARAKAWAGGDSVHIFDMPLSVGGRFSLWSAASLACMIGLGTDTFRAILRGAAAMDAHVQTASPTANIPMCLALLDFWNTRYQKQPMRVQLAYANRLRLLPTYLQQLEMESNGKTVSPEGQPIVGATAPALWGGEGSVGQHSYHQWLHQGSQAVPCEFILAPDAAGDTEGRTSLIAHALAQAEVLCNGRSLADIIADEPGVSAAVAAQKVHAGGRASTFFVARDFGPEAFGALIALFEHRTFLGGVLWGVNSFDQWGVERGKVMAGRIKGGLEGEKGFSDPVTKALAALI